MPRRSEKCRSLDLPRDEDEPEDDNHLDTDVNPTGVERDGTEVVEPPNGRCILERLRGPDVAHCHAPKNVHYY